MPVEPVPVLPAARRAAALLLLESLALAVLAVVAGLATAAGEEAFRGAALGLAVSTAAAALLVLGLGLAVRRARSWARTPALVVQLVALPVGTDQVLGHQWVTGSALLLIAGATAFHLLAASRDQVG